jgi:hypothetical protein
MPASNPTLEYPNPKKASASKPYRLRFTDFLSEVPGDVITSIGTIVATPSDLTISNPGFTDTDVFFTASAGTAGRRYRIDVPFVTPTTSDTVSVFLRVT